jgi:hypothetical protein
LSSGHDPDLQGGGEEEAPWDANHTAMIVAWAVLVAVAAVLFPLMLNWWSSGILESHITRHVG